MFLSAVAVSPETPTAQRQQPVYTHVAAAGLALVALAPIVMLIVALVSGVSVPGFLYVAMVVPLIAAALAWRFDWWASIVALVVTLVAVAGLFWLAFGITIPAAFGDFVPGVAFVTGVVLALGGSIAALVQHRRGNLTAGVSPRERRIISGAGALVLVAALVSAVISVVGGLGGADPAAAAGGTPVTMADFQFAEGTYEITAGQDTALVVHNSDGFAHDIAIPQLGVEAQTVLPGQDSVVDLAGAEPGTYTVYCTLHSDVSETDPETAGMAATLVVQ